MIELAFVLGAVVGFIFGILTAVCAQAREQRAKDGRPFDV